MKKTTLVVMAAGLGSRYGGDKQIDGLGPNQEVIMDYSIYDAIQAGFNKVVFIIKKEMYDRFHEVVGSRVAKKVEVAYAYQGYDSIPDFYPIPPERTKPFGTVHAVVCAKHLVQENFCVINADDYYGPEAFVTMFNHLQTLDNKGKKVFDFAMVGYQLKNTLSDNGTVTRGVCDVNEDGQLARIVETYKIRAFEDGSIRDINFNKRGDIIDSNAIVSMNFWGFTPEAFFLFEDFFFEFLHLKPELTEEYGLPDVIKDYLEDRMIKVSILTSDSKWFGVTYQADKAVVQGKLKALHEAGAYPRSLIDWYN